MEKEQTQTKPTSIQDRIVQLIKKSSEISRHKKDKALDHLSKFNYVNISRPYTDETKNQARLEHAFDWAKNELGFEFWADIHNALKKEFEGEY